jgi:hypothetical protein
LLVSKVTQEGTAMSWITYYVELSMQEREDELHRRLAGRERWEPATRPRPRRWTWSGWLPPRPGEAWTRRGLRARRSTPGRPAAA